MFVLENPLNATFAGERTSVLYAQYIVYTFLRLTVS